MQIFSMKKRKQPRLTVRAEPRGTPGYTAATMEFLESMEKKRTPVTVRVEPPGYRSHVFVLPASDLFSPHFAPLMTRAYLEYGAQGPILVAISCTLDHFVPAMTHTVIRAPPPVGWDAVPLEEPSSPRRTLGWFLARTH